MPVFSRFLRYFTAVARLGSIRRAADELHVSASAIDRQILAAEQELGTRLFERLPSGLRLTAAGEMLLSSGTRWQKGLFEVRAQIEDLKGLRRGHVEIAVIDALSKGFVPRLVRRIHQDYPGISIGIKVLDNGHIHSAVTTGDVDFGLQLDPLSSRDLQVRAHVEVALGLVTKPDHPLAAQPTCRFAASTAYRLVTPAEPLALCRQLAILAQATDVPMNVAASSDDIQMIKSLVIENVGVGILTSLDTISEVEAGELAFIRITDAVLKPLTLALCVVPSRQLSSAANLLLGQIESAFGSLGRSD